MASSLIFKLGGTTFEAVPVKLEKKKLYGYTDVVATDAAGAVCQMARSRTSSPFAENIQKGWAEA